jgi:release factor glutamine methyltransferase
MKEILNSLSRAIGRSSAQRELRWMKEALASSRRASLPKLPSIEQMLQRRVAGEPLQYILGTQPFGTLELRVRPPTLIPRPETEEWTIRLAERLRPTLASRPKTRVLDLCTGTGCIPLLLCNMWAPHAVEAVGVDVSDDALLLARENAEDCRIDNKIDNNASNTCQVEFVREDILSPAFCEMLQSHCAFRPGFHVITSNPPYIPLEEYNQLDGSVKEWEDPRALIGDPEDWPQDVRLSSTLSSGVTVQDHRGLAFYRALARLASVPGVLAPGCPLVMEVGHNQARDVEEIMQGETSKRAFSNVERWKDAWGVERVVVGWKA